MIPPGLSDLEAVADAAEPNALVTLPAAYVLDIIRWGRATNTVADAADVHARFQSAVMAAGSPGAWAEKHGVTRQYVSVVLNGKRPSKLILDALGLCEVVRYESIRSNADAVG